MIKKENGYGDIRYQTRGNIIAAQTILDEMSYLRINIISYHHIYDSRDLYLLMYYRDIS